MREPIEILVNGRFLMRPVTGVERVAMELLHALDARLSAQGDLHLPDGRCLRFAIAVPPGHNRNPFAHLPLTNVGRRGGHWWEQFSLPHAARGKLLLSLCNTGPVAVRRQVVMLHDAATFAAPRGYSWRFRTWYRVLFPLLARRAVCILTNSRFSAEELARHAAADPAKLRVIPLGFEHMLRIVPDASVLQKHGLEAGGFVLIVGSRNPNKNLPGACAALAELKSVHRGIASALVGVSNSDVFADHGTAWPPGLVPLGRTDDTALAALYQHALCLLFPSHYEGFGLPAIEAMALRCPVVASNRAALPEVCGGAALLADPDSPGGLARAIARIASEPGLRESMVAAGQANLDRFGWERATDHLIDALLENSREYNPQ